MAFPQTLSPINADIVIWPHDGLLPSIWPPSSQSKIMYRAAGLLSVVLYDNKSFSTFFAHDIYEAAFCSVFRKGIEVTEMHFPSYGTL